jgi:hypothetical protein
MRAKEKTYKELYLDPQGEIGLAEATEHGIVLRDDEDIQDNDRDSSADYKIGNQISKELPFYPKNLPPWPLPGKPEFPTGYDGLDLELYQDLVSFIREHVWIQTPRLYEPIALWIMSTWINGFNPVAPRILAVAPTDCGKTRLLKVLRLTAYRPIICIDTSKASLYRSIQKYGLTMLIDEFQDIPKESKAPMNAIVKGGFEPDSYVPRVDLESAQKLTFLRIFCPMAIASREMPILDVQNRSITVHMRKYFGKDIKRLIDEETALDLRTRLLAFSLQVKAGKVDLQTERAQEMGLKEIYDHEDNPGETLKPLGDRPLSIATTLLQTGLLWHECDDTLVVLAESEQSTQDELQVSKEGIVFNGLQGVVDYRMTGSGTIDNVVPDINNLEITINEISNRIYDDLEAQGQTFKDASDKAFKFKPQSVGRVVKHSFGFKRKKTCKGSVISDKKFAEKYDNLCKKYGDR